MINKYTYKIVSPINDTPIHVGDLEREEAVDLLTMQPGWRQHSVTVIVTKADGIPTELYTTNADAWIDQQD